MASVSGWRVEGDFPDVDKAIFVASPHTSNWDGFYMLMCAWYLRVRLSWITKHTMFRFPIAGFIRWAGGVPVDRRSKNDTVGQIADQFAQADSLYLAIAPAGTRAKRDFWKSGFYHMAQAAKVPLILGYVDYKRKAAGVGPVIHLTGDVGADMDRIRAFYDGVEGPTGLHTRIGPGGGRRSRARQRRVQRPGRGAAAPGAAQRNGARRGAGRHQASASPSAAAWWTTIWL